VRLSVLLLVTISIAADTPPLENTGQPIAVPFQCNAQQLDEAGLTCTSDDPCHVYLELTGIDSAGDKLFLTGNLHTRVTTLSSIVLESADGGRTWTEPVERTPLTSLEGIQFIDFSRGWIAGESVQPLPRDPFLLITNDGGRSWQKQAIFEDEHPGSIEAFHFDSHEKGSLEIDTGLPTDRHQFYETSNGGAAWTLARKSSSAMALRGQRSSWSYHADARNGTYKIEKQGGDPGAPAAAFLIEVTDCRGE